MHAVAAVLGNPRQQVSTAAGRLRADIALVPIRLCRGVGGLVDSPAAIRRVLDNEKYASRWIWNRTESRRDPRTGRRRRFEKPETQWAVHEDEQLRIIPKPSEEVDALRRSREKIFRPPPIEWIREPLSNVQDILGRPFYRAVTTFNALALIEEPPPAGAEGGSNTLQRWRRRERKPRNSQTASGDPISAGGRIVRSRPNGCAAMSRTCQWLRP